MSEFRIERDSMGEVRVPAQAYYVRKPNARKTTFPFPAGRCRRH